MNYEEALNFIKEKQSLGIMPGLSRIKKLLNRMDNPQNKFKIIHIAGTNGKGTVALNIANALINNGYKVGLFTSPWVVDYREQIQINNRFIKKREFAEYVDKWQEKDCSEFEFLTALMYKYFADNNVDYAVIECGMGGKGDSTNVENKNLSVITSISLDHTDFLGKTIFEIAEQKSGILRKNSDCILYSNELEDIFKSKCKRLIISDKSDNLSIVNTVLKYLKCKSINSLSYPPARLERINGKLIDGGHNPAAALKLAELINNETALIGMMKDKDVEKFLSIIAPKCSKIIATSPDNPRSMPASELAELAKKYCNDVSVTENPKDAVKFKDITLICGSFYLARDVRKLIL